MGSPCVNNQLRICTGPRPENRSEEVFSAYARNNILLHYEVLINNAGELAAASGSFFALFLLTDDHRSFHRISTHNLQMPEFNITLIMVQAHLKIISVKKSAGSDEICPQLLKILSPMIEKPFALLCNLSLESGVLSND